MKQSDINDMLASVDQLAALASLSNHDQELRERMLEAKMEIKNGLRKLASENEAAKDALEAMLKMNDYTSAEHGIFVRDRAEEALKELNQ